MVISTCAVAAGSITGFIAKQYFTYHFLTPIKDQLAELISDVARSRIGIFAARIISHELAMVFSIPVTLILSDLVYSVIKEIVVTVVHVAGNFFAKTSSFIQTSLLYKVYVVVKKVVSVASYYLSRAYFCHYSMPFIKAGVELVLRSAILLPPFQIGIIATTLAITITPPLAFMIGDLVGIATSEMSCWTLDSLYGLCFGASSTI